MHTRHVGSSGRHRGYCAVTAPGVSDCAEDELGTWELPKNATTSWAAAQGVCTAYCAACQNCRYVSFSARWGDCSWFSACDLSRLERGVDGFQTVQVSALPLGESKHHGGPPRWRSVTAARRHGGHNGSSSSYLTDQEIASLHERVARARGVFIAPRRAVANALFVTAFNAPYMPIYRAWSCRVDRLGFKYLVWAGNKLELADTAHATVFHAPSLLTSGAAGVFNSRRFNSIAQTKLVVALCLLSYVSPPVHWLWLSDPDTYFISDPWPHLHRSLAAGCEYVFQVNT